MPPDERQTEGEIAQILQGLTEASRDSRMWERFFTRLWPYVVAVTHRLSQCGADAEDVAQEVFMQFAQFWHSGKGEQPRSEGQLKALLSAMARHQVSNDVRRFCSERRDARRDRPLPDDGGWADGRPSAGDLVELQDLLDHINAELNPEDRRLLQLLIAGYTEVEAAKELGVTERTIRRRLAALRATVRKHL
jgi:RNA polymerase sigma factor (sigma-70 family)